MKINWLNLKKLSIILGGIFENNNISQKLKEIENTILDQNFWKDKNKAKKIIKEKQNYEDILNSYKKSNNENNRKNK